MTINITCLIGIIFFYVVITAIGVVLTYRKHWLIKLWNIIRNKKKQPSSRDISIDDKGNAKNKENNDENNENIDLALGGRSLGLLIGSFTLTAGWVGGGYISGTAEQVYDEGLLWTQAPFAFAFSLLVGGLMFSKKMRSSNYVTMLDPFQLRYGDLIGATLIIPAFIAELFWSLSILISLATTLSVILDIKVIVSISISAAAAVIFTMFGGLPLLANTDLIQLTLVTISLWVCVPIILSNNNVKSIGKHFTVWSGTDSFHPYRIITWIDNCFFLVFGGIPWQTYFQKILSCKSTKVAFYLSFTSFVFCIVVSFPAVLIGGAAKVTDWSKYTLNARLSDVVNGKRLPKKEFIFPITLVNLLPSGFLFVCLGSIAASTLSSTDSSILSAATMISHNMYKNVIRPKATDKELSIVLKVVVVVMGLLAISLSLITNSAYSVWILSSDLVYIILFPRLCSVVYFSFTNSYGGIFGSLVASFLRILWGEKDIYLPVLVNPGPHLDNGDSVFPFRTFIMLIGFSSDIIVSKIAYYLFMVKKIDKKYDFLKMLNAPDFTTSSSNNSNHVKS